jgi:hypothetical protein
MPRPPARGPGAEATPHTVGGRRRQHRPGGRRGGPSRDSNCIDSLRHRERLRTAAWTSSRAVGRLPPGGAGWPPARARTGLDGDASGRGFAPPLRERRERGIACPARQAGPDLGSGRSARSPTRPGRWSRASARSPSLLACGIQRSREDVTQLPELVQRSAPFVPAQDAGVAPASSKTAPSVKGWLLSAQAINLPLGVGNAFPLPGAVTATRRAAASWSCVAGACPGVVLAGREEQGVAPRVSKHREAPHPPASLARDL